MANATAAISIGPAASIGLYGLANLFPQHPYTAATLYTLYALSKLASDLFPSYGATATVQSDSTATGVSLPSNALPSDVGNAAFANWHYQSLIDMVKPNTWLLGLLTCILLILFFIYGYYAGDVVRRKRNWRLLVGSACAIAVAYLAGSDRPGHLLRSVRGFAHIRLAYWASRCQLFIKARTILWTKSDILMNVMVSILAQSPLLILVITTAIWNFMNRYANDPEYVSRLPNWFRRFVLRLWSYLHHVGACVAILWPVLAILTLWMNLKFVASSYYKDLLLLLTIQIPIVVGGLAYLHKAFVARCVNWVSSTTPRFVVKCVRTLSDFVHNVKGWLMLYTAIACFIKVYPALDPIQQKVGSVKIPWELITQKLTSTWSSIGDLMPSADLHALSHVKQVVISSLIDFVNMGHDAADWACYAVEYVCWVFANPRESWDTICYYLLTLPVHKASSTFSPLWNPVKNSWADLTDKAPVLQDKATSIAKDLQMAAAQKKNLWLDAVSEHISKLFAYIFHAEWCTITIGVYLRTFEVVVLTAISTTLFFRVYRQRPHRATRRTMGCLSLVVSLVCLLFLDCLQEVLAAVITAVFILCINLFRVPVMAIVGNTSSLVYHLCMWVADAFAQGITMLLQATLAVADDQENGVDETEGRVPNDIWAADEYDDSDDSDDIKDAPEPPATQPPVQVAEEPKPEPPVEVVDEQSRIKNLFSATIATDELFKEASEEEERAETFRLKKLQYKLKMDKRIADDKTRRALKSYNFDWEVATHSVGSADATPAPPHQPRVEEESTTAPARPYQARVEDESAPSPTTPHQPRVEEESTPALTSTSVAFANSQVPSPILQKSPKILADTTIFESPKALDVEDFPLPDLYDRNNHAIRPTAGVNSREDWRNRQLGSPSVLTQMRRERTAASSDDPLGSSPDSPHVPSDGSAPRGDDKEKGNDEGESSKPHDNDKAPESQKESNNDDMKPATAGDEGADDSAKSAEEPAPVDAAAAPTGTSGEDAAKKDAVAGGDAIVGGEKSTKEAPRSLYNNEAPCEDGDQKATNGDAPIGRHEDNSLPRPQEENHDADLQPAMNIVTNDTAEDDGATFTAQPLKEDESMDIDTNVSPLLLPPPQALATANTDGDLNMDDAPSTQAGTVANTSEDVNMDDAPLAQAGMTANNGGDIDMDEAPTATNMSNEHSQQTLTNPLVQGPASSDWLTYTASPFSSLQSSTPLSTSEATQGPLGQAYPLVNIYQPNTVTTPTTSTLPTVPPTAPVTQQQNHTPSLSLQLNTQEPAAQPSISEARASQLQEQNKVRNNMYTFFSSLPGSSGSSGSANNNNRPADAEVPQQAESESAAISDAELEQQMLASFDEDEAVNMPSQHNEVPEKAATATSIINNSMPVPNLDQASDISSLDAEALNDTNEAEIMLEKAKQAQNAAEAPSAASEFMDNSNNELSELIQEGIDGATGDATDIQESGHFTAEAGNANPNAGNNSSEKSGEGSDSDLSDVPDNLSDQGSPTKATSKPFGSRNDDKVVVDASSDDDSDARVVVPKKKPSNIVTSNEPDPEEGPWDLTANKASSETLQKRNIRALKTKKVPSLSTPIVATSRTTGGIPFTPNAFASIATNAAQPNVPSSAPPTSTQFSSSTPAQPPKSVGPTITQAPRFGAPTLPSVPYVPRRFTPMESPSYTSPQSPRYSSPGTTTSAIFDKEKVFEMRYGPGASPYKNPADDPHYVPQPKMITPMAPGRTYDPVMLPPPILHKSGVEDTQMQEATNTWAPAINPQDQKAKSDADEEPLFHTPDPYSGEIWIYNKDKNDNDEEFIAKWARNTKRFWFRDEQGVVNYWDKERKTWLQSKDGLNPFFPFVRKPVQDYVGSVEDEDEPEDSDVGEEDEEDEDAESGDGGGDGSGESEDGQE